MTRAEETTIRAATEEDAELLFALIVELASYEKLADAVRGDPEVLRRSLFERRAAEALVIEAAGEAIGYAIFFTTFSTFECKPGIWLEDVYVRPEHRRGGIGRAVMEHLARARGRARPGAPGMVRPGVERAGALLLLEPRCQGARGLAHAAPGAAGDRAAQPRRACHSSRGVMRKTETTSAWCASGCTT